MKEFNVNEINKSQIDRKKLLSLLTKDNSRCSRLLSRA